MRAFIAIELPQCVKEELAGLIAGLKRETVGVRWTDVRKMHLTLRFFGDIGQGLTSRVEELVAGGFEVGGPLDLCASGLGGFPNPGRPRLIWTGVGGEVERLKTLFAALEGKLAALGVTREARPFTPHLTLGRADAADGVQGFEKAKEDLSGWQGSRWRADEVVLFESILGPGGARHVVRARGRIL